MSSIGVSNDTVTGIGTAKVLFIVSGATYWVLKEGTGYTTGYWAEEFANPCRIRTDAGHEGVVATPNSVTPNVDMMSLRPEMTGGINGALTVGVIIRSRCTASRLSPDTSVSTTSESTGATDRRAEGRERPLQTSRGP